MTWKIPADFSNVFFVFLSCLVLCDFRKSLFSCDKIQLLL